MLSLREFCKKGNSEPIDFTVELLDKGTPAGTLSGTLWVRWGGEELGLKTPEKKLTRKEKRLSKRFTGMEPLLKQSGKGY